MSKSIYPSIPQPGKTQESVAACLDAVRQTLSMMILNAQSPSPNFSASSAAQIFVTRAQLVQLGLITPTGATKGALATASAPTTLVDRVANLEARLARLEGK
jgi:hypothetical protein